MPRIVWTNESGVDMTSLSPGGVGAWAKLDTFTSVYVDMPPADIRPSDVHNAAQDRPSFSGIRWL